MCVLCANRGEKPCTLVMSLTISKVANLRLVDGKTKETLCSKKIWIYDAFMDGCREREHIVPPLTSLWSFFALNACSYNQQVQTRHIVWCPTLHSSRQQKNNGWTLLCCVMESTGGASGGKYIYKNCESWILKLHTIKHMHGDDSKHCNTWGRHINMLFICYCVELPNY